MAHAAGPRALQRPPGTPIAVTAGPRTPALLRKQRGRLVRVRARRVLTGASSAGPLPPVTGETEPHSE